MAEINQDSSIFNGFVKNTIIFYLLLVIVGYLSTLTYYGLFGINISDYLGLEDYINMFMNNLSLLLILSLYMLVVFTVMSVREKKSVEETIQKFTNEEERKKYFDKKHKRAYIQIKVTFIITLCLEIILLIIYLSTNNIEILRFIVYTSFLPIMTGGGLCMVYLNNIKFFVFHSSQVTTVLLVFGLAYFKFLITFSDGYYLLARNQNKQKITFIFDNKNFIKTTNDTLFLGNSKDYLFLYTKSEKKALLYNKSHIESIMNEKKYKSY